MTQRAKQMVGVAIGIVAIALLSTTVVVEHRINPWVWHTPLALTLALAGLNLGFESVWQAIRSASMARFDALGQWWNATRTDGTVKSEELPVQVASASAEPEAAPLHEAQGLLVSILAEGPVKAKDVYSRAESAGVSRRTLQRAKARLGVKVTRITHGNEGRGYWLWQLPDDLRRSQ